MQIFCCGITDRMSYLSVICLLHKGMPLSRLRRRALAPHCSVFFLLTKGTPCSISPTCWTNWAHIFPWWSLPASSFLRRLCWWPALSAAKITAPWAAVGKAGENGVEMLRALNFRRFEAKLLLRRATSLCTREAFLYLFISLPFLRFYVIMPTKRTKEKYAHEIF